MGLLCKSSETEGELVILFMIFSPPMTTLMPWFRQACIQNHGKKNLCRFNSSPHTFSYVYQEVCWQSSLIHNLNFIAIKVQCHLKRPESSKPSFLSFALQFVSKHHPEDVKEVVVWRRFSELKKLHGDLAYTHRNLFRRQEEFPPFPRAQVFGML